MMQRPRLPAIAVILSVSVAGGLFLGFSRRGASPDAGELAKLQAAAAAPDARPADWQHYADKLRQLKQPARAAVAYQRALEGDPYNRDARLACATCLAQAGDADPFYAFMRSTLLVDPKLTLSVLGRPEAAAYMTADRFQTLHRDAVAQSLD